MASVELSGLSKAYGTTIALNSFDLAVESGKFCVLLGPSGCGKSTLLRLLAGLDTLDAGTIRVDGQDIGKWPPAKRQVAMVFQDYTLYPHMKVRQNICYALQVAGLSRTEIEARLAWSAKLLGIAECLENRPHELSGGQRQRVAIAKCLVRQPKIFLFDEPLSNLDADLRVQIRQEVLQLHRHLRSSTSFFVTHDQQEALAIADLLVVMDKGQVQQVGTPQDIYSRPANQFVAGFVGSPRMNFLRATWIRHSSNIGHLHLEGVDYRWLLPKYFNAESIPEQLVVGIRPEHWQQLTQHGHSMQVAHIEFMGQLRYYHGQLDSGQRLTVQAEGLSPVHPGDTIRVGLNPNGVHLFDPETELRIHAPWLADLAPRSHAVRRPSR